MSLVVAPVFETQVKRTDELVRTIEARTSRQIQDLNVVLRGRRVVVTGRSRTWYQKQLVTQALHDTAPELQIENAIQVA